MHASLPNYGETGRDASALQQGGYSAITTQAEVTKIEGVVDHAQLKRQLRNATNPAKIQSVYRGASPNTLSIKPRQMLFALRRTRKGYTGSGERVFGALNGYDMSEYVSSAGAKNYDGMRRCMYFAGVSKSDKPMQGASYAETSDPTGIAYLISGSISMDRNTGPKRIAAGDTILLVPPSIDSANPHTNRAGCDPSHITMQTVPYDPADQGITLMGIHASYGRGRDEPVAPGIDGIPFQAIFYKNTGHVDTSDLSDQQWMSLAKRTADDAVAAAYIETLIAAGKLAVVNGQPKTAAQAKAAAVGLFDDLGALGSEATPELAACRDAAFLNHCANVNDRITLVSKFKETFAEAFDYDMPKELENDSAPAIKYARLRWDGPQLGIGAILAAKYANERWCIGRALTDSAPGDTLDADIGRGRGVC